MNEWEWKALEENARLEGIEIDGIAVRPGDRVRLHPKDGGDILDIALRGQVAIVESIEEDYEGARHISVVLEADPGRDLGMMRQPGHRFFFTPAEVEPIARHADTGSEHGKTAKPTILIAGIGNIFFGDDGFGVEVARRMMAVPQPRGVHVVDFGIRGFDLAYALQAGYETTVLVDAYAHGQEPGTVTVIEPDLDDLDSDPGSLVEPHAMNPRNVFRMVKAINGTTMKRVLLVGCEPLELGGEEGCMGLSVPVEAAVDDAVTKIGIVVDQILNGHVGSSF